MTSNSPASSPELPKLPELPEPYKAASTIKCTSCGAPYEPARALAPNAAAGFGGRLMSSSSCRCGNSQFSGTLSTYDSLSPAQFTADHLRDYAAAYGLACYEAGSAAAAQTVPKWISVEVARPEFVGEDDTPVWTWDGHQVREDEYGLEWDQPAGPVVGGWVVTGEGFQGDTLGRVTHWMPRNPPAAPTGDQA